VLLPVFALVVSIALLIFAPHFGPIFPRVDTNGSTVHTAFPGFFYVEFTIIGGFLVTGFFMIAYETVATARYGRTLGKAWLHIRPVRVDGRSLGWGASFGRVAIYWLSGALSWLGALDALWCLWDDKHQCLHDKAAGSIVVNDGVPVVLPGRQDLVGVV
jgi:uncharacterized RDD family membrane protein YckC